MRTLIVAGALALSTMVPSAGRAQNTPNADGYVDKYKITALEKAACAADALRMCSHTYPDQDRLIACLRSNMPSLSLACSVAFKTGLKRRGMAL